MAIHLIVDGYNFMAARQGGKLVPHWDLELSRQRLLEEIRRVTLRRPIKITVVFDAPGEEKVRCCWKGMEVVFAGGREKADGAIARLVSRNPHGVVVATSDRALAESCRAMGATVMSSRELGLRIMRLQATEPSPGWDEEEDDEGKSRLGRTQKKGPARRLSKRERRDKRRLRKL